jgi:hypothetical protein
MNKTQIRDLIKKAANRKKGIGAIPVGLKFTIAGVKMYVEAQYDIYNKVHINIIEQGSLKTVVKIDGVAKNKKDQIEKLERFIKKDGNEDYTGASKKLVDQLSSEVDIVNNKKVVKHEYNKMAKQKNNISPSAPTKYTLRRNDDRKKLGIKSRKIKLGDAVVYKNRTWYITVDKNGATGIVNMAPGAYGSSFPTIMLNKIDVANEIKDLYGNKVSIPYTFKIKNAANKSIRKFKATKSNKKTRSCKS